MSEAPGQMLAAIAKAMGQVHKVAKEGRNKHDGYNFASIDDFLALVNPICAENGLIVHMQEGPREDFERQSRSGTSSWMRQSFDLTLYHVSGESLPPVTRTVEVLRNGAQAYGSAQSYALKQFWRATLLIPTGDKDDPDLAPKDDGPVMRSRPAAAPPRQESKPAPKQADESAVAALIEAVNAAETLEALSAVWKAHAKSPAAADGRAIEAKNTRKAALSAPAETQASEPLVDDTIPH